MGKNDSLKEGAIKAYNNNNAGSHKTQYNHLRESLRFVDELRSCGSGVQKWSNITNKHVAMVVESWKDRSLAASTIKENLSGVRATAEYFGNDKISGNNSDFGIENRVYVTNRDKSIPDAVYQRVLEELKASERLDEQRVAAQISLMREFGLRKEEAFKLNPERALLNDGRLFIQDGTKGGKERLVHDLTDSQREALSYASSVCSKSGNTMSEGKTERKWEKFYYKTINKHGVSKKECGASGHGFRHAYAHERYQSITGFLPPCKFNSKNEFREAAYNAAGESWKKLDQDARQILKSELGHGPERGDVVAIYLGSK